MRAVPSFLLAALIAAPAAASAEVTSLSTPTQFVAAADGAAMWASSPDGLPAHGEPAVATTDVSLLAPGSATPLTRTIRTPEYVRLWVVGTDADDAPVAFVLTNSATYRVAFDGSSGPVRVRDPSHGEFAMHGGRVARVVERGARERIEVAATLDGPGRPVLDVPPRWRVASMALGRDDTVLLLVVGASRTARDRAELWRVRRGVAPQVLRTARDRSPSSGVSAPVVSQHGTRVSVSRWSTSASRPNDVSTFSVATGRPLARRAVQRLGAVPAEETVLDPHRSLVAPTTFDDTCGRPTQPACIGLGLVVR